MSTQINHKAIVPVRLEVTASGVAVSNTGAVGVSMKDLLIAAFEAIPNQAGGTATVAAIVTALKTLP
jgi:hypothetical protein